MTKDVLVKISGLQFSDDQDNDPVEIITTGSYYKKMESTTFFMMRCRKALTA